MATVYMRVKFKIASGSEKFSQISKETFGQVEGAYVDLSLLVLGDNPKLEGKLTEVNFSLLTENLVAGRYDLDVQDGRLTANCDAIFKMQVRTQWEDASLDPNSRWAIGGINLSASKSIPVNEIEGLEGVSKFESVFRNHYKNTDETDKFLIVDVKAARKKTDVKL